MITTILLSKNDAEGKLLERSFRGEAARCTDERMECIHFLVPGEASDYMGNEPVLDFISWSLTSPESYDMLSLRRKNYRECLLMVVADSSVSPMRYLRPSISPNALLLRPYTQQTAVEVVRELFGAYDEKNGEAEEKNSFTVDTREGRRFVPYRQIYLVEAREKRIFIRTRHEEYGFYETIEKLSERLPETFLRCHRSYIVNMEMVEEIHFSENLLVLKNGESIPFSRSYRKDIKNYERKGI